MKFPEMFRMTRGAALFTTRYPSVGADGLIVTLPFQAINTAVHFERGATIGRLTGSRPGSGQINLTEYGPTVYVPIVTDPGGGPLCEFSPRVKIRSTFL